MATEEIIINGQVITTLKELLRPGLKAVFVGLNPAIKSVEKGHYYQGRLGRRFWDRLVEYNLISERLADGAKGGIAYSEYDEVAYNKYDFGFADLVRRPTKSSDELSRGEKRAAVPDLLVRLRETGDHPIIVFVFREAREFAGSNLEKAGYRVVKMPGPFETKEGIIRGMLELKMTLKQSSPDTRRRTFPSASQRKTPNSDYNCKARGPHTTHRFTVIFEKEEEGGYHVFCPTLPGCHTQSETIEEGDRNIREAIQLYVESLIDDGLRVPQEDILIKPIEIPA